jgi:hypothetical protein
MIWGIIVVNVIIKYKIMGTNLTELYVRPALRVSRRFDAGRIRVPFVRSATPPAYTPTFCLPCKRYLFPYPSHKTVIYTGTLCKMG